MDIYLPFYSFILLWSIHPSVHSEYLSIYSSYNLSSILLSSFFYQCTHAFSLSVHLFFHSSIHPSIQTIYLSILLSSPSIHPLPFHPVFISLSTQPVYLLICPFIHPFGLFIQKIKKYYYQSIYPSIIPSRYSVNLSIYSVYLSNFSFHPAIHWSIQTIYPSI